MQLGRVRGGEFYTIRVSGCTPPPSPASVQYYALISSNQFPVTNQAIFYMLLIILNMQIMAHTFYQLHGKCVIKRHQCAELLRNFAAYCVISRHNLLDHAHQRKRLSPLAHGSFPRLLSQNNRLACETSHGAAWGRRPANKMTLLGHRT